jgi:Tfp pilus assembly protein PilN
MTARVNLLPREIEQQARARRSASWAIGGVAAFAAVLGLLYLGKLSDVQSAREERDAAEADVATLQQELASLQEFAELDRQLAARNALLRDAMALEISWARVLNDLSLTFPPSSSLTNLSASAATAEAGQPANPDAVATLSFEGYSVERYAPGVERVLVKFDEVTTFFNSYLGTAGEQARGDTEVTTFSGTVQLNDESYTGRYADGLPPEVGR